MDFDPRLGHYLEFIVEPSNTFTSAADVYQYLLEDPSDRESLFVSVNDFRNHTSLPVYINHSLFPKPFIIEMHHTDDDFVAMIKKRLLLNSS